LDRKELNEAAVDRANQIGSRRDAVVCEWEKRKRKTKRGKLSSYKAVQCQTKLRLLACSTDTFTNMFTHLKLFTRGVIVPALVGQKVYIDITLH
jgi:hypothetical protein